MDSETYWRQRIEEREAYWFEQSQKTIEAELAAYYEESLARIQTDIAALYGRFARDNKLSMSEARKLLTGQEFRVWRKSIEQYVKEIKAGNKGLERELNVLAMRSRISRLDKLYADTLMELDKLGRLKEDKLKAFLTEAYKDNYYHGMYAIGKTIGLRSPRVNVSNKQLEDVLRARWSGENYSARIWTNQKALGETLKQEMTNMVHRGESVDKVSKRIAQKMATEKKNAVRLVRTELNYVENQASLNSIKDTGLEYYRFTATLDHRTSQVCREHDGQVYPVEDASPGDNMPPMHPHCRSVISGSLYGPEHTKSGKRIAKDEKGRNYYVPADMSYKEWIDDQDASKGYLQFYLPIKYKDEAISITRGPQKILVHEVEGAKHPIYVSSGVKLRPKHLHLIEKSITEAQKLLNIYGKENLPNIYILTTEEMQSFAPAIYSPQKNTLYLNHTMGIRKKVLELQDQFSAKKSLISTYVHEYFHWIDAERSRRKNKGKLPEDYRIKLISDCYEKVDALIKNGYNINKLGRYANYAYSIGEYDEVYTEYRVYERLT